MSDTAQTFHDLIKPALEGCAHELERIVSKGLQDTPEKGGKTLTHFRKKTVEILGWKAMIFSDASKKTGNPFFALKLQEGERTHLVSYDKGFSDDGKRTFMIRQENGEKQEGDILGFFATGDINNVRKDKAAFMLDWLKRRMDSIREVLEK